MPALSTSWKSTRVPSGEALVEALKAFPITGVELEYRITDRMFAPMRQPLKASGIRVVSVHNYFPSPTRFKGVSPGGDMFSLSDPEAASRRRAVEWTRNTLRHANELEAGVVVLHCGAIDIEPNREVLAGYFEAGGIGSDACREYLSSRRAALAKKKPRHMDSLMFSLDTLAGEAEKQGVVLGLENRYYDRELPGPDDFAVIFEEFSGAPLGYWHDTGHAHAAEVLGLVETGFLLKRYGNRLVGAHLHDARGPDDHLPPGSGDVDFAEVSALLGPAMPRVMELKPGTPDREVAEGLDWLRKNGVK